MKNIKMIVQVILGNLIYALVVKLFILPTSLMSSGTTGIALLMNHYFGIEIPFFIFLFNMFWLLVGLIILGKKFVMTTIISTIMYPVSLQALNMILGDIVITENLLLNTIFAGMGLGLSLGIVLRAGASTGGMDIPPIILNKFFRIPISISLYFFDFIILSAQAFYNPLEKLLYGILLLLSTSIVLDKVLMAGTTKTEVKIISEKSDQIVNEILSDIDRGVTLLDGHGGYLKKKQEIILSVISNRELPKIERLIKDIDPDAFMIVSKVTQVWGKGFSTSKHYQ